MDVRGMKLKKWRSRVRVEVRKEVQITDHKGAWNHPVQICHLIFIFIFAFIFFLSKTHFLQSISRKFVFTLFSSPIAVHVTYSWCQHLDHLPRQLQFSATLYLSTNQTKISSIAGIHPFFHERQASTHWKLSIGSGDIWFTSLVTM
jgi:hypothetical protein